MPVYPIIVAIAAFAILGLTSSWDLDEARLVNDQYCEMVQLGIDTDGALGWPDYNENADRVCRRTL